MGGEVKSDNPVTLWVRSRSVRGFIRAGIQFSRGWEKYQIPADKVDAVKNEAGGLETSEAKPLIVNHQAREDAARDVAKAKTLLGDTPNDDHRHGGRAEKLRRLEQRLANLEAAAEPEEEGGKARKDQKPHSKPAKG